MHGAHSRRALRTDSACTSIGRWGRNRRQCSRMQTTRPNGLRISLADVTVMLAREDGTPVRQLYSGPVADSLLVSWDGLTSAGTAATDGRYLLQVTPRTSTADGPRARQVVLEVKQEAPDTLSWPPPLTTPPLL